MAGEFLVTIGDVSQLDRVLRGEFLKGHSQPRIAMVGRSNVGKSSLINALAGVRLAQVSNQPGKTRLLHFYLWKDIHKVLVDLPGYGFAKASGLERDHWAEFINEYLKRDSGLERVLVLLDARHGPTLLDEQAIRFLSFQGVPVTFIFTKSDALKTQSIRVARQKEVAMALQDLGSTSKDAFWVSTRTGAGLKELTQALGT